MAATVVFSGCGGRAPATWVGGPVTPSPIAITVNPSALPVGATMPTGITLAGREMVLYFWSRNSLYLDAVWRDVTTGVITDELPGSRFVSAQPSDPAIVQLAQLVAPDRTLVEYGAVRGTVGLIVCEDNGIRVEAQFTQWSENAAVTVFWLRRQGSPVPDNTPAGPGRMVPLEPERYPLLTVYDTDGRVSATSRIRPPGTAQRTV
jgi:hypothetical protein